MKKAPEVVAVVCSDLHLSLQPPIARSLEKDWLRVQARYLKQLEALAVKHAVPILCAGDLLHTPNLPPEFINWALDHVPDMWAIPGQHDLPLHNYKYLHKSAFYTLCKYGNVKLLEPNKPQAVKGMTVVGYPWECEITEPKLSKNLLRVALVHKYCWYGEQAYPGAPSGNNALQLLKQFPWFDTVVFGDNHKPFSIKGRSGATVFNCGGFQRRNIDEMGHRPRVGLLYSDGSVENHYLFCAEDVFLPKEKLSHLAEVVLDSSKFKEELDALGNTDIDLQQATERYCQTNDVSRKVRKILNQAMSQ